MSKTSHKDFGCLLSINESIDKIFLYIEKFKDADDFFQDSISFDATMMNFIIIGEMADKLSDEFKNSTESQIDWFKIKGFRNIIAHNYFGIDAEEVWQIIHNSLGSLKTDIEKITR